VEELKEELRKAKEAIKAAAKNAVRRELIKAVFTALDLDRDEQLSSEELYPLARHLRMTYGSDAEWVQQYQKFCAEREKPVVDADGLKAFVEGGLDGDLDERLREVLRWLSHERQRQELIQAIFTVGDRDRDGTLNEKELRPVLGVEDGDKDWSYTYTGVCRRIFARHGREEMDVACFQAHNEDTTDEELRTVLPRLMDRAWDFCARAEAKRITAVKEAIRAREFAAQAEAERAEAMAHANRARELASQAARAWLRKTAPKQHPRLLERLETEWEPPHPDQGGAFNMGPDMMMELCNMNPDNA